MIEVALEIKLQCSGSAITKTAGKSSRCSCEVFSAGMEFIDIG